MCIKLLPAITFFGRRLHSETVTPAYRYKFSGSFEMFREILLLTIVGEENSSAAQKKIDSHLIANAYEYHFR